MLISNIQRGKGLATNQGKMIHIFKVGFICLYCDFMRCLLHAAIIVVCNCFFGEYMRSHCNQMVASSVLLAFSCFHVVC